MARRPWPTTIIRQTSGTLTFGPAETTMQVTVLVNGDTTIEPDETFTVELSGAHHWCDNQRFDGTGTITNDDLPPPPIVYVDDDWVGTTPGTDPDGAGTSN